MRGTKPAVLRALVAWATWCVPWSVASAQDADADPRVEVDADAGVGASVEVEAPVEVEASVEVEADVEVEAPVEVSPEPEAAESTDVEEDDPSAHTHAHSHSDPEEDIPMFSARAVASASAPPLPAAASDFVLPIGALRAVPRRTTESLLTLAPGLFLVSHSGAYHASSVFLRGFDAGEGQDLEVLVSGIPINEPSNAHGHGYADAHFVIPELVRSVRVTEGPFDPRQSDFAVAGTAEYRLGARERGVRVQGELGSFDQRRLLLSWAPSGAEEGTFVAFDLRDSAGFGAQRAATSVALNAGYEHVLSREVRISMLAFAHFADFGSAGVVRQDDVALRRLPCAPDDDAQFFCAFDPNQGGASARTLLAATLSWRRPGTLFEQTIFGGWRRLRIRENFTGFLLDPRGDGLDEQYEAGTVGLRGRYRIELRAFDDLPQHIELGWIARHDSGSSRSWRVRAEDDIPYAAVFDDELHVTHIGAHLGTDLRFAPWIALRAGVRADAFAFSTIDRAEPDRDRAGERIPARAIDALGISLQPRGTLRIALAPGLEWQTSAGVGTRSSDATALSEGEMAPFARAIATETGLALRLSEGARWALDARAVAFHTHVDHDLLFDPDRGRNVAVGASSRLGALAYLRAHVERWLDVAASFAWTEAFLLPTGGQWQEWVSDTRVPYVPRWIARVDASVEHPIEIAGERVMLGGGVGLGILGERPIPLGGVTDPAALLDLGVRARWRLIELGVQAQNLLDQRWQQSVFRYPSQMEPSGSPSLVPAIHASAGAPLSVMFALTILFDETQPLEGPTTLEGDDDERSSL